MTLEKLIQRYVIKPDGNLCEVSQATDWIAEMDGRILQEDYLQKNYKVEYNYETGEDMQTELLIREPWTEMYVMHLMERVHFYRGEYEDAANFAEQYNKMHKDWLRNLLMTVPTDRLGRPWLMDIAFVRRGSDGVVHMRTMFLLEDVESLQVYVVQDEQTKVTIQSDDDRLVMDDRWLSVNLTGEDTAALNKGSANLIIVVNTVAGERYESDAVQIRVMENGLKGVRV